MRKLSNGYKITLAEHEVAKLKEIIAKNDSTTDKHKCAKALLLSDSGPFTEKNLSLLEVAEAVGLSHRAVNHLKGKYLNQGFVSVFQKKRSTPRKKLIFTEEVEEKIIQLYNSEPPAGHRKWSVRLLASKAAELKIVEKVSHTSIHNLLRKYKDPFHDL